MDPLKVSAQFAAFTWFADGKPDTHATQEAARRFAQENWVAFLPYAHKGWGRLLLRIATLPYSAPKQLSRSLTAAV